MTVCRPLFGPPLAQALGGKRSLLKGRSKRACVRGSSQQPSLAGNFPTKTRPVVRLHPLSNQASRSQTTTECPGLCPVGRVKTHDFSAAKMTRPEKIEAEVVQCPCMHPYAVRWDSQLVRVA
ncbi:hypothetical protein BN1708_018449 [Verticillium longisporum]|uniref:Uncharacterized protein n=1 Tax=Verticillium longisporum TaxID=100787 RepID=A0A0G4M794_VERLO|nr:hypothetical protein BN1708_018449 [Verticillium longisporum]